MMQVKLFYSIAVFFILLSSFSALYAQCPPGSVYVYNQNQVNDFLSNYPDCEEINGSLIISFQFAPEITDLTPFQNIKRVNGDLQAAELNSLTNLYGLHNVEYVEKTFRLNMLPLVTSVTEMKNLKEVGEFITILNMPNLISVDSFNALTFIGKSLNITRSPKLQTISSFENLETVNFSVTFELNPELTNIPTFPSLKHIGLSVKIVDAPKIIGRNIFPKVEGSVSSLTLDLNTNNQITFSGFHHLDSIRTDLILNLPNGIVTNAFQNLEYIGGNATITTDNKYFSFGNELKEVAGYLSFHNCTFLKSLGNFHEDLVVGDYIALWNNSVLNVCNVPFICRFLEESGDLSIVGGIHPCSSINVINCSYTGISGTFYFDQDQDGVRDETEYGISNLYVEVPQNNADYVTNLDGRYFFDATDGSNYTVTADIPAGWNLTTDPSYSISFSEDDPQNRFYDFGLYPAFDTSSFDIRLFGSESRCSRYSTVDVKIENNSTASEVGIATLYYDDALTYAFSVPPPDVEDGVNQQLIWYLNPLPPFDESKLRIYFKDPATLPDDDSLHFELETVFGNDTFHNQYSRQFVCQEINVDRKFVSPDDGTSDNFISVEEELVYSVEVQNNVVDEVRDVIIYDTLSPFIDMSTFTILDHSHPVSVEVDGNVIKFSFNELFLLDTAYSVNQSHAFVTYSVKPKADAPTFSEIENKGYIHYDDIPYEVTNTVINTLQGTIATDDLANTKSVLIFPNPNHGTFTISPEHFSPDHQLLVRVSNLQGQVVNEQVVNNTGFILYDAGELAPGLYILTIKDINSQSLDISKIIIK